MDTQRVTAEYRLSQWAQVIQRRQESGQSVKDFCQTTGINRNAYFYWQRKLRRAACTELQKTEEPRDIVPNGWVQLSSQQPQQTKVALDIEISNCHVIVNTDTDLELLKKVCQILKSL